MENTNKTEHEHTEVETVQSSITSNVIAATTETVDMPHLTNLVSGILNTGRSGKEEDIHSFLARPSLISSILFQAQGFDDDIVTINLPDALTGLWSSGVLTGGVPLIKDKLKGFLGMRANFKIKVQVNANQFQQGMLLLRYVPYTRILTSEANSWNNSMVQKTQHYSTVFDISCDTEVDFNIPFVYPGAFYSLVEDDNRVNLGTFYITVYSPLKFGTGSNSAEITTWVSMHDVELIGPVIPMAQSSDFKSVRKAIGIIDQEKRHAGEEKKPSATKVALDAVGDFTSKVPLLSSFSAPLKWMGRMLNEPASYFGFSTPNLTMAPMFVQRSLLPWFNNADQPRISNVLGVTSDNAVAHLPGFAGTDFDEMTISSIAQRFAYHDTKNWNLEDPIDTQIAVYTLFPINFGADVTVGSVVVANRTPLGYVGEYFNFWRGGIKIRIRVVKTNFHSGRLLVAFQPGQYIASVPDPQFTNNNTQYLHRHIIDIREGNVAEISIPYISVHQWLEQRQASGTVSITVLNPLRAPDTVSNNVDLIIEVAGDEDIEFAVPTRSPCAPWTPEVGTLLSMEESLEEPLAQMDACAIVKASVGSSLTASDNGAACAYAIGEKITSVRQLCKRHCFLRNVQNASTTDFDIAAFALYGQSNAPGGIKRDAQFSCDTISYWGACFALQRGSMNYVVDSIGGGRTLTAIISEQGVTPYRSGLNINLAEPGFTFINILPHDGGITPYIPVVVPSYSPNFSRLNHVYYETTSLVQTNNYTGSARLYVGKGNTQAPRLWRAIGDDFSFGQFVACPPLAKSD